MSGIVMSKTLYRSDSMRVYLLFKRGLDFTLAASLLILLFPLMLLIAAAIWVTSGRPILIYQRRLGKDSREFTLYKFRSMVIGQWDSIHQEMVKSQMHPSHARRQKREPFPGTERRKTLYKTLPRERFTLIGPLLRKTSLDELPQLWNVLKGEMSLVGPRPPLPHETNHYETEHFRRLSVVPGLSGLWQVSGRSQLNYLEMVRLDLEYVQKRSFWMDIKILIRTHGTLFLGS